MPENAELRLRGELLPNEKILLVTHPDPSKHFARADIVVVPFSLLWGGFAIYWESSVFMVCAPLSFKIFGIPFVLMGLYVIFGRFVYKAWDKRRTVYALTDKRVIVLTVENSMRAEYVDRVAAINKTVRKDGFGTITFGSGDNRGKFYVNTGLDLFGSRGGYSTPLAFYDIPDAEQVYRQASEARAEQSRFGRQG